MNRRTVRTVAAACAMGFLILHAPDAAAACREGIQLCIQVLIPSLFPFFLVSCLLTDALANTPLPLLRPIERLCRIPAGSGCLLLTGLLGGYPAGAQSVGLAYRTGRISRTDGERMISFCSNAGPAFLFGMVAPFFDNPVHPWLLWAVHILSALLAGFLIPGDGAKFSPASENHGITAVQAMDKSIRSMASVCGWVILFRMVLGLFEPALSSTSSEEFRIILSGLLELSNGCIRLDGVQPTGFRFFLASGMLSFGGICVTMQTGSVCGGLSMKRYIPGKLLQLVISFALSALLQPLFPAQERISPIRCAAVILLVPLLVRKPGKNKGSIPAPVGV